MNTLLDHVGALIADPLFEARSVAAAGSRVVGYVGNVPAELILAANARPVHLRGKPDESTPYADRFVERAFRPETRSIAEQWVTGAFDFIDAIVLPRSDDGAQRLYYYICELQRQQRCEGPRPLIYDIAGIERASSREYSLQATMRLAQELGTVQAHLPSATREVLEQRTLLKRIADLALVGAPPDGSALYRIARAAESACSSRFNDELRTWIDSAPTGAPRRRVLFAGNSPPDDRIHLALENSGATVVRELTDANDLASTSELPGDSATLDGIASRYQSRRTLAQALASSADTLADAARTSRADGVLIWMIEEDETLPWELPAQLRALEAAAIPTLTLTRQSWSAPAETLSVVSGFASRLRGAP